jgi:hypothetical protein
MTDYIFVNIALVSILPMLLVYKICMEKFNDSIIEDASPKSRSILTKFGFANGFIGLIGLLFIFPALKFKAGQGSMDSLAIIYTIIIWCISIIYVIRKTKSLTQNKGSRTVRLLNIITILVTSMFSIAYLVCIAM